MFFLNRFMRLKKKSLVSEDRKKGKEDRQGKRE